MAMGAGKGCQPSLRAARSKNCHGRGKRMPAQLACRTFENHSGRFHRQRRHGIWLRTRRIEGTGARETRNTNFPFHFRVVRLQIGVRDRPIGETRSRNRANLTALDEIDFMKAPVVCGEVHGGATDAPAIGDRALLLRFVIRSFTEGIRLQFGMIREQVFLQDFDFVVREIGFREVGALLEDDNTKTVRR